MRHYTRAQWDAVFEHMHGKQLVGQPEQGVREQFAAPRYEIGSRLQLPEPDGRIFHYCRADIAHPMINYAGIANGDRLHFMNSAVAAGVVGDRNISVVIDPLEDPAGYVRDQFRGGSITIHTLPIQIVYNIIGNEPDDGINVLLHLGEPLLANVPLPTFCEIHENQYNSTVPMTGAGNQSVVAVPLMPILINNYFWGQTWGKCLCGASVDGGMGFSAPNEQSVYFFHDGSIGCATDLAPNIGYQYAGYVIPTTLGTHLAPPAEAGEDSIYFMLQLDP